MNKYERKKVETISFGNGVTTFSRVRNSDKQIQLNKDIIHLLNKDEIEINVLWCDTRRIDLEIPESEVDKKVFDICKKKGIEKHLMSAMVKQGKMCFTEHYTKRVKLMAEMVYEK